MPAANQQNSHGNGNDFDDENFAGIGGLPDGDSFLFSSESVSIGHPGLSDAVRKMKYLYYFNFRQNVRSN